MSLPVAPIDHDLLCPVCKERFTAPGRRRAHQKLVNHWDSAVPVPQSLDLTESSQPNQSVQPALSPLQPDEDVIVQDSSPNESLDDLCDISMTTASNPEPAVTHVIADIQVDQVNENSESIRNSSQIDLPASNLLLCYLRRCLSANWDA
jgi:hypothetical protein